MNPTQAVREAERQKAWENPAIVFTGSVGQITEKALDEAVAEVEIHDARVQAVMASPKSARSLRKKFSDGIFGIKVAESPKCPDDAIVVAGRIIDEDAWRFAAISCSPRRRNSRSCRPR